MRAFVLRMAPDGVDWVPEGLESDQISIGWGHASELMDRDLDHWQFREVVKRRYYGAHAGYQKAGSTAGVLWRFLRDMSEGDLVVVPHGGQGFYVASVRGEPVYLAEKADEHTAFRRPVEWLNDRQPIPRRNAHAPLQSRMKIRQTCGDATDLIEQIEAALGTSASTQAPTFGTDLRSRLIDQAKAEMTSGRMDSYGFENLVATLLRSLGATEVRVVGRSVDLGVDVIATFSLADTFTLRIGVQAKHYRPDPPVGAHVVDQLASGMEAEELTLGWVATSGSFSSEAVARKAELEEERAISIELLDGDQLAAMIVDGGLRAVGYSGSVAPSDDER